MSPSKCGKLPCLETYGHKEKYRRPKAHVISVKTVFKDNKKVTEVTTREELYKISYPCGSNCCHCAYSNCLGPVRIYFTKEKKEVIDLPALEPKNNGHSKKIGDKKEGVIKHSKKKDV